MSKPATAKARIIAQMRAQAKDGLFDGFPEFKALCLGRIGYDPAVAQSTLAPHATKPGCRDLDSHVSRTHRPLAREIEVRAAGG